MNIISYTYARQNLASVLQKVHDDYDPAIIMHKGKEPSVIIPLSQWEKWNETEYLLSNPVNAARLKEAVRKAEKREGLISFTDKEFFAQTGLNED